ncbi:CDP-archaeol synthase [Acetobacteraceae bacterium]|nr:CDP-archaeol synthase [Acetobacteraceae bacterium]
MLQGTDVSVQEVKGNITLKKIFHSKSGWADLMPRLLSAIVLSAVSVFVICYGHWPYILFIALISFFVVFEGLSLARGSQEKPFKGGKLFLYQSLAVLVALIGGLGFFYLRMSPFGVINVFFVVLIVAACDTGAYFSGRIIGGRKLAPSISPGKTVSGAIGGLFFAVLLSFLLEYLFTGVWIIDTAFYAILLGISSQLGDLCESAAKRRAGVKDSGKIIPGHGGILDRLDGMLGAIPIALFFQFFAGENAFWTISIKDLFHVGL